jgi:hypothetical protein
VSVFRLVSQPLFGFPSQFAKPEAHVGAHVPLLHVVAPFAFVHETPQAPQFVALVFRFASQPLAALPSQFPKPVLQV